MKKIIFIITLWLAVFLLQLKEDYHGDNDQTIVCSSGCEAKHDFSYELKEFIKSVVILSLAGVYVSQIFQYIHLNGDPLMYLLFIIAVMFPIIIVSTVNYFIHKHLGLDYKMFKRSSIRHSFSWLRGVLFGLLR